MSQELGMILKTKETHESLPTVTGKGSTFCSAGSDLTLPFSEIRSLSTSSEAHVFDIQKTALPYICWTSLQGIGIDNSSNIKMTSVHWLPILSESECALNIIQCGVFGQHIDQDRFVF
jgi:hypothetical protein